MSLKVRKKTQSASNMGMLVNRSRNEWTRNIIGVCREPKDEQIRYIRCLILSHLKKEKMVENNWEYRKIVSGTEVCAWSTDKIAGELKSEHTDWRHSIVYWHRKQIRKEIEQIDRENQQTPRGTNVCAPSSDESYGELKQNKRSSFVFFGWKLQAFDKGPRGTHLTRNRKRKETKALFGFANSFVEHAVTNVGHFWFVDSVLDNEIEKKRFQAGEFSLQYLQESNMWSSWDM